MFSFKYGIFALCLLASAAFAQHQKYEGIGRAATANEVKAWDIDVRPDFKGLPKGAGSVSLGEQVWEGKCASCHGTFGESNSVFFQLVGFTTKQDVQKGNAKALQLGHDAPARTMSMKLSTLSTLWDYINRAMPWTAPKSLSADEVYGVTAFLLNLSNVVPDNFVLSDKNIQQVQALLPNRNGMTTKHAMWPGKELNGVDGLKAKPDTQGSGCIKNCNVRVMVSSSIPAYAMTAHGNLADQNRTWTSVLGLDTSKPMDSVPTQPDEVPASLNASLGQAHAEREVAKLSVADVSQLCKKTHARRAMPLEAKSWVLPLKKSPKNMLAKPIAPPTSQTK